MTGPNPERGDQRPPPPNSISEEARAALRLGAARQPRVQPALDDTEGWRRHIETVNAAADPWVESVMASPLLHIAPERINGVAVYRVCRAGTHTEPPLINLHLHGGGWAFFGGRRVLLPTARQAIQHGGMVYGVDYRCAPDHRFPAALDDCAAVYRSLIRQFDPASILVTGESAGGNLAAALMLRMRDEGLPRPAALFLNTPALDLTHSGDSIETNRSVDVVLAHGIGGEADLYRGDADPRDPLVSPLFGDPSGAFPPTYLRTGTRDLLLSDAVRMHALLRRHGLQADLYVGEAMPHGGFAILGAETPEDVVARDDLDRWLDRTWRQVSAAA